MFRCHLCLFVILLFFNKEVFSGFRNFRFGATNENKIVGGVDANIKAFPYQASLSIFDGKKYYQCGGSIISKSYILTAAHCLVGMTKVYIRIGSSKKDSDGQEYEAIDFHYHPSYNKETLDYDVGVVHVKPKLDLDNINSKAIKLVNSEYELQDNAMVVVSGWGTTQEGGSSSQTLKAVTVPVVSRTECSKEIKHTVTPRMFCAGYPQGGQDACQGDSGGPVVIKSSNLLVGIVSFGYGCARSHMPGVYTNIGDSRIRSYIKSYAKV